MLANFFSSCSPCLFCFFVCVWRFINLVIFLHLNAYYFIYLFYKMYLHFLARSVILNLIFILCGFPMCKNHPATQPHSHRQNVINQIFVIHYVDYYENDGWQLALIFLLLLARVILSFFPAFRCLSVHADFVNTDFNFILLHTIFLRVPLPI